MTRGILIGLVLGIAIGAGITYWRLAPEEPPTPPTQSPAPRPDRAIDDRPPPPAPSSDASSSGPPARPASGKPEHRPAPARTGPVNWPLEKLVAELRRIAEGKPLPPKCDALNYGLWLSRELRRRALGSENIRIPAEVITKLLDSGHKGRFVGAGLVALGEPDMTDEIVKLALDSNPQVRMRAVGNSKLLPPDHPAILRLLSAATDDPDPRVRRKAVQNLGRLMNVRPDAASAVVAATRDPDLDVRYDAIQLLEHTGPAGSERAFEILVHEEYHPDLTWDLVSAVVAGGRILDALRQVRAPGAATELLRKIQSSGDEETIRQLAGRFRELRPLYQVEEDHDYVEFFRLAAAAGDGGFLGETVASTRERPILRLLALEAGLEEKRTQLAVLDAARVFLSSSGSHAEHRMQLIDGVENMIGEEGPAAALAIDILREVSQSDPNGYVRKAAREALNEE